MSQDLDQPLKLLYFLGEVLGSNKVVVVDTAINRHGSVDYMVPNSDIMAIGNGIDPIGLQDIVHFFEEVKRRADKMAGKSGSTYIFEGLDKPRKKKNYDYYIYWR